MGVRRVLLRCPTAEPIQCSRKLVLSLRFSLVPEPKDAASGPPSLPLGTDSDSPFLLSVAVCTGRSKQGRKVDLECKPDPSSVTIVADLSRLSVGRVARPAELLLKLETAVVALSAWGRAAEGGGAPVVRKSLPLSEIIVQREPDGRHGDDSE